MDKPIDIAGQIQAVARRVAAEERGGEEVRTVVLECTYPTSVEDLWDAVTSAERLPRWFAPVTGDLRLGGRFQIEGNAEGEITDCEPPSYLGLTWEYDGELSWVEARLWPDGSGARLQIRHAARPGPAWDQFGPGAGGVGWELALLGLTLHTDTGTPMVPEDAAAWMASESAGEFMRASSEAWREAHVASGASQEEARAAADATIAAYTGGG